MSQANEAAVLHHPNSIDFLACAPATTEQDRRRFWATISPQAQLVELRARAARQDVEFLRTFKDMGGFCFPHRLTTDSVNAWLERVTAMGGVLARHQLTASHEATSQSKSDADLQTYRIGLDHGFQEFHLEWCAFLSKEALLTEERLDLLETMGAHADTALTAGLAIALATACAIDSPEAAGVIVGARADAMQEWIRPGALDAAVFARSRFAKKDDLRLIAVNPYLVAMQFSSIACMDVLSTAGFRSHEGFARCEGDTDDEPRLVDVLSLHYAMDLHCASAAYAKAVSLALGVQPSSQEEFLRRCLTLVEAEHPADRKAGTAYSYIPALVQGGAFDFDPTAAFLAGCVNGHSFLVASMVDRVDWGSIALGDLQGNQSVLERACANSYDVEEGAGDYDQAMALFVDAAVAAGFAREVIIQRSETYDGESRDMPEPLYYLVTHGYPKTLRALFDAGLDPRVRLPHPGCHTALEIADTRSPELGSMLRALIARNAARSVLDDGAPGLNPA